ncbi:hypothetical protein ACIQKE_13005 [Streptomyces griseoviridis]
MSEEHPETERPEGEPSGSELASVEHPVSAPAGDDGCAPPAPPRRRRRVARVVGGAVLACAVLAGVGATVVTVRDADRDPGKPSFEFQDSKPVEAAPASAKGLGALLVPYGTGDWSRGPDFQSFGSDAELSGARAQALRKEELSALPRTERRQLEKQYDEHPVKGMAMRSYLSGELASRSENKGVYTASLILTRVDSRAQAREQMTALTRAIDALRVFRAGPAVKRHKDAKCFLQPAELREDIDRLWCFAAQGDIIVTAVMNGVWPLDTKGAATLLAAQLDRIAEPGEAV